MLEPRFTEPVGCRHPVQVAGMPRICTPERIVAVEIPVIAAGAARLLRARS